jgi:hypothetical protein
VTLAYSTTETAAIGEVTRPTARTGVRPATNPCRENEPMPAIMTVRRSAARTSGARIRTLPDPLPKPPSGPPGEPIIIRHPPKPPEEPEIDDSIDEEDEPEIKQPPEIVPEKPPPPAPWERADRRGRTSARHRCVGKHGGARGVA